MSFVLAGSVLMLALFARIMLDDIGGARWQQDSHDVRSSDPW
jgi:hypothetical protein